VLVEAIRFLVTLAITALGFGLGTRLAEEGGSEPAIGAVVGAGIGYVLGGVVGRTFRSRLTGAGTFTRRVSGHELFAGAFGVLVGLFIGAVVGVPLVVFLPPAAGWPLAALVVLMLSVVGARLFAARAGDLLRVVGISPITADCTGGEGEERIFLVDTSAAIDGRVLHLNRAGLMSGRIEIPAFVVDELQMLADSGERSVRRRGRRGLEVLEAMGRAVVVIEDDVPEFEDVDAKLVALAARSGATLVTTDFNLAKAAGIRGIPTLNLNHVSDLLQPTVAVGDKISVEISKPGSEPGQGVGFLDDGTMVVVEEAYSSLGSTLDVVISGVTRTAVGRMLFGRRFEEDS